MLPILLPLHKVTFISSSLESDINDYSLPNLESTNDNKSCILSACVVTRATSKIAAKGSILQERLGRVYLATTRSCFRNTLNNSCKTFIKYTYTWHRGTRGLATVSHRPIDNSGYASSQTLIQITNSFLSARNWRTASTNVSNSSFVVTVIRLIMPLCAR